MFIAFTVMPFGSVSTTIVQQITNQFTKHVPVSHLLLESLPTILPANSTEVTYGPLGLFNAWAQLGTYATDEGDKWIKETNEQAKQNIKEARKGRREEEKASEEDADGVEGTLYGHGVGDFM